MTTQDEAQPADIVDPRTDLGPFGPCLSPDEFKFVFRGLPAGVSLITAATDGKPAAMTATSLSSLSAEPPLFSFSASATSSTTQVLARADTVVAHILTADELWLAKLGAERGADRFADTSIWEYLPTGEPLFSAAKLWIRGCIVNRFTAGESIVHVVEALQTNAVLDVTNVSDAARPLVYHNRTWHTLGDSSRLD